MRCNSLGNGVPPNRPVESAKHGMSAGDSPQISILDARLAEIDRRLSAIQTGLLDREPAFAGPSRRPAGEMPEPAVAPADLPPRAESPEPAVLPARVEIPEPPVAATESTVRDAAIEKLTELRGLAVAHGRLLESLQRLLGSYERALTQTDRPPPAPAAPTQFSVSAGPFASTEALHGFERTLAQIPEVRDVQVRAYEGEDRAIVDVHLHDSTS